MLIELLLIAAPVLMNGCTLTQEEIEEIVDDIAEQQEEINKKCDKATRGEECKCKQCSPVKKTVTKYYVTSKSLNKTKSCKCASCQCNPCKCGQKSTAVKVKAVAVKKSGCGCRTI